MFVPDVVNNLNVKVFNLMSKTNETRHIKWHEKCKCKSRLDASVCNKNNTGIMINAGLNIKNWFIKDLCDKGYIWNSSNCECECDKSCDVGEYLDYKKLADKLVEECTENIDEVKMASGNMHKIIAVHVQCTLCCFQ